MPAGTQNTHDQEDRMTAPTSTTPDHLAHHELDMVDPAQRFTPADLDAIRRYEGHVDGMVWGGSDDAAGIRAELAQIQTWWQHLDFLAGCLGNRGPACHMGTAGHRYLTAQANAFFHTLNQVRRDACQILMGDYDRDGDLKPDVPDLPGVDSGFARLGTEMVQLDGTAVAESR